MKIYIDESGSTGDLTNPSQFPMFNDQPCFSLAAIGISDEEDLKGFINSLKRKYKIQSTELKANGILEKKPKLILDICEYIEEKELPFFIEVVDKKYQLLVNIESYFITSLYLYPIKTKKDAIDRIYITTMLYNMSGIDDVIMEYLTLFHKPSDQKVLDFSTTLEVFIKSHFPIIAKRVNSSLNYAKEVLSKPENGSFRNFLAPPDIIKSGKEAWILPHYTCLSSIIARINKCFENIESLDIVHDEHHQFDVVIEQVLIDLKGRQLSDDLYEASSVNFSITEIVPLRFESSTNSYGLQVADILAGLLNHKESSRINNSHLHSDLEKALNILIQMQNESSGIGINQVIPQDITYWGGDS